MNSKIEINGKTITYWYCHYYSSQQDYKVESKRHYKVVYRLRTNLIFSTDILGKQNNKLPFFYTKEGHPQDNTFYPLYSQYCI